MKTFAMKIFTKDDKILELISPMDYKGNFFPTVGMNNSSEVGCMQSIELEKNAYKGYTT